MSKKHQKLSVDQEISFLQEMDTAIIEDIDELEERVEVVEERTKPWNWSWLPPTLWGTWAVALVFMAGRVSFTWLGVGTKPATEITEQVAVPRVTLSWLSCGSNSICESHTTISPDDLVVETRGTGKYKCKDGLNLWTSKGKYGTEQPVCLPIDYVHMNYLEK